jgi:hypothetical protein
VEVEEVTEEVEMVEVAEEEVQVSTLVVDWELVLEKTDDVEEA